MIPIRKGPPPPVLVRASARGVRALCAAYDADPKPYQSGVLKMNISRPIYASKAVKDSLVVSHNRKCCYCETLIETPYADLHVEHWRPKLSSRQGRDEKGIWPGYYWLAYSWDNLLLSCSFCNRDNKRDLFPLKDPAKRARNHRMKVEHERPAILKPDGDLDPRDHIIFEGDRPVGRTALGRKTIDVLRLDSQKHKRGDYLIEEIEKRRKFYMNHRENPHPVVQCVVEEARKFLEGAVKPERKYSAMVADYLKKNPLPVTAA
jgi:uncharacterized protein (TIGR02646 family)